MAHNLVTKIFSIATAQTVTIALGSYRRLCKRLHLKISPEDVQSMETVIEEFKRLLILETPETIDDAAAIKALSIIIIYLTSPIYEACKTVNLPIDKPISWINKHITYKMAEKMNSIFRQKFDEIMTELNALITAKLQGQPEVEKIKLNDLSDIIAKMSRGQYSEKESEQLNELFKPVTNTTGGLRNNDTT